MPGIFDIVSSSVTKAALSAFAKSLSPFFTRPDTPTNLRTDEIRDTSTGYSNVNYRNYNQELIQLSLVRRRVWQDLDEMDMSEPLVSTSLDIIADCATGYEPLDEDGFDWQLTSTNTGPVNEAAKILGDMKSRCELGQEAWQIARGFVRQGEEFREVILDDDAFVRRFKSIPSYQLWPNFDDRGNKIPGWEQRPDGSMPGSGIQFEEWQIVPFIYGARRGYFGTGIMVPARRAWRRLQKIEDGMVLARLLRSYDKLKHKVPVRPEWDVTKQQEQIRVYKDNMTKKKVQTSDGNIYHADDPLTVETDFFIPEDGTGRGDIDILHGQNVQLQRIDDVKYIQQALLARTKVPRHYLNLGSGNEGALTEGGTTQEDIQFARTLRQIQAVLRKGLMEVGALALFLQGYDPDELGLKVVLPKINTEDYLRDSQAKFNMAQTCQIFAELFGSLPSDIVIQEYMGLGADDQAVIQDWLKKSDSEKQKTGAFGLRAEQIASDTQIKIRKTSGSSSNSSGLPAKSGGTNIRSSAGSSASNSPKGGGRRRNSTQSDYDEEGWVETNNLVQALTSLRYAAQNAVEKYMDETFDLGESECQRLTSDVISDALLSE